MATSDDFGNYPREKFDPFSVMLFKALQTSTLSTNVFLRQLHNF